MSGQAPMPGAIAWIDGRWGTPAELGVPLHDRGLLLADGLFETVLVQAGRAVLLEAHLQRWRESAAMLAMDAPPDAAALEPLIREAIARAGLNAEAASGALRLNWSRGDGSGRGIDLPADAGDPGRGPSQPHGHRFWLQLNPFTPSFTPQTAHISRQERRNGSSRLSRCKTFAYGQAIQARREAREAGAEEALLLSTAGGLSCGAVANLLVRCHGRWLTPPLSSGCLPGVMRGRALALGLAEEAELSWEPLPLQAGTAASAPATAASQRSELASQGPWLLLNSLGCRPLRAVDGRQLPHLSAAEAEAFWRQLLAADPQTGPLSCTPDPRAASQPTTGSAALGQRRGDRLKR